MVGCGAPLSASNFLKDDNETMIGQFGFSQVLKCMRVPHKLTSLGKRKRVESARQGEGRGAQPRPGMAVGELSPTPRSEPILSEFGLPEALSWSHERIVVEHLLLQLQVMLLEGQS